MAAQKKTVAFAESSVTVHVKRMSEPGVLPDGSEAWDVESKVMTAGNTMPLSDMPPYLSEAILSGSAPGLVALTANQAKRVEEAYASQLGLGALIGAEEESDPAFPAEEI
jgi:hypothetical protein